MTRAYPRYAILFPPLLCFALGGTGCDDPTNAATKTSSAATNQRPQPDAAASASKKERAVALAKRVIIVDGHVDLPYRLHKGRDKSGKLAENVAKRTDKGDFDFERAMSGGLNAPFMSIYVPAKYQKEGGAKKLADSLIDMVEGLAKTSPDKFYIATSVADVKRSLSSGKVALPLGIENGAALEGKLANVAHFHGRGVRYITLTHSKDNDICDSSYDERHTHRGLSDFGKKVVAEMNRLGIMVDVSHISDDAFWQVAKLTKTPLIASHSSCRHFTPGFERNMNDEMIKELAKLRGVIMINFGSTFLSKQANRWGDEMHEERKAMMKAGKLDWDHPKVKEWSKSYRERSPLPFASVEDVADHIEHVIKLVGVDHVGLGSDFDGVGDSLPTGLKDASYLPRLIEVLLGRGHSEGDVEKICSGNVLRVWKAVEDYAAAAAPAP